jgi:hypothetical protein
MPEQQRIPPPVLIGMTSPHKTATGTEVYEFLPAAGRQGTTLVLAEGTCVLQTSLPRMFPDATPDALFVSDRDQEGVCEHFPGV